MGDSGAKLTPPGNSSHHSPNPFLTGEALAGRQETVVSPLRRGEEHSVASVAVELPVPSPVAERLFPSAATASSGDSVAGLTVGHFVIERRIGSGGMGTVFLARDERLQRPVALKILSPQQTADAGTVQRFLNEARAAARLDHDHVARVFYYGEDQGLHYIAYEFVQGTNLRDLIRAKGRLEPTEAVSYAVQLTTALCHFSANGVVHRDIKPSNIIITPQGKAKLVDLGLARKESLEESAQLTVAGTTLGTFDYISPEQARDPRAVDVRSDVYSLGCTLYHALTGEPPYPEGTVLQRLLDHQDKPPPDPALKNRRVPPALSAVVRKMMAYDPRKRYPTAEDLLRDLLVVAHALGLRGVTSEAALPPTWPLLARRSRIQTWGWSIAAAIMIATVLLLSMYPDLLRILATAPPSLPASSGASADSAVELTASPVKSSPKTDPVSRSSTAHTTQSLLTDSSEHVASAPAPVVEQPGLGTNTNAPTPPTLRVRPSDATNDSNQIFEDPTLTLGSGLTSRTVPEPEPLSSVSRVTSEPPTPTENSAVSIDADRSSADLPRTTRSGERSNGSDNTALSTAPFVLVGTGKSFETLDAACAEIRDQGQGLIELQYDGRLPSPQRQLRLINKRVTIQAAKGYRPILWFAPKEPVIDLHQSRMIFVAGGTLSLINIDLELQVPELSTADLWALISCARPDRLRLQDVLATVSNPRNHAATLVEFVAPVGEGLAKMGVMKESTPLSSVDLVIDRCLLRGECSGFRIRDPFSLRCEAEYSLFATGEWLFHVELPPALAATSVARLTVNLNHNTFLLGNGLYTAMSSEDSAYRVWHVEFMARNNVFASAANSPLIEQQASTELMDPRKMIEWRGDRNYFDNWEQFWVIRASGTIGLERWNFAAWCAAWGDGEATESRNDPIVWQRPWRQRRWSEITADDARLDPSASENPPRGSDAGRDAGAIIDQLPGTGFRRQAYPEGLRP